MRNYETQTRSEIPSVKGSGEKEGSSGFGVSGAAMTESASEKIGCYLQYQEGGLAQRQNLKDRGVTRVGRSCRAECGIDRPDIAGICVEFRKCGKRYVLQNVSPQSAVSVNNIPLSFGKYQRVEAGDNISLSGVKLEIVSGVSRPWVDVSYQENPEVRRFLAARKAMAESDVGGGAA